MPVRGESSVTRRIKSQSLQLPICPARPLDDGWGESLLTVRVAPSDEGSLSWKSADPIGSEPGRVPVKACLGANPSLVFGSMNLRASSINLLVCQIEV